MRGCAHCGVALERARSTRRFCSTACRKRAWRRRAAGIEEHVFRAGAAGGQTLLSQVKRYEVDELLSERPSV